MFAALTVDPGKHGVGAAFWSLTDSGPLSTRASNFSSRAWDLLAATYVLGIPLSEPQIQGPLAWVTQALAVEEDAMRRGLSVGLVVVETMHIYTNGKARPADLLELQAVASAICARFPSAQLVGLEASTWKGQVPRDILANRVAKKVEERGWADRLETSAQGKKLTKTQVNDVMHAIGIGLHMEKAGPSSV